MEDRRGDGVDEGGGWNGIGAGRDGWGGMEGMDGGNGWIHVLMTERLNDWLDE